MATKVPLYALFGEIGPGHSCMGEAVHARTESASGQGNKTVSVQKGLKLAFKVVDQNPCIHRPAFLQPQHRMWRVRRTSAARCVLLPLHRTAWVNDTRAGVPTTVPSGDEFFFSKNTHGDRGPTYSIMNTVIHSTCGPRSATVNSTSPAESNRMADSSGRDFGVSGSEIF
jgi:hypothetical protein